jgi:DNA polymerase-1
MPSNSKPPIYLLDTMAFIFRAYHAMQRSRPMTTRTGVPTAATYVFVNMINKLRADFKPDYLAAVYDVGAPLLRKDVADQLTNVQKFNIKTQQFETTDYAGYKANRAETPPDLIQQHPYIRRALEAFRIPIIFSEGYEADDVIGTLATHFAALGHHVYVVSPDKDMMQLVNDSVSILNPTKDNLILNPAKVEEVLGVPPARVIDVMALRGDSIDNIPGAPGIGDKGSVELIQTFGTVEAAMDAAVATPDAIKRKVYRESLQNNRDNILLSKELVTIHCSVPIAIDLDAMRTQPVDNAACRALFTELEFTSMLRELAPDLTAATTTYNLQPTPEDIGSLLSEAKSPIHPTDFSSRPERSEVERPAFGTTTNARGLALALAAAILAEEVSEDSIPEDTPEPEPLPAQTMDLFGTPETALKGTGFSPSGTTSVEGGVLAPEGLAIGLSVSPDHALQASLTDPAVISALTDPTLPKLVHDLKAVLRALEAAGIALAGPVTDVMLQSYLLNPTHASHTLVDIAARTTSLALKHQPTKDNPTDPRRLPEAAAAIARLATTLHTQLTELRTAPIVPADDPSLGGAATVEMLYADKDREEARGKREEQPTKPSLPSSLLPLPSPLHETSTLLDVYAALDLPLVPVLLRMEQAGVRIDTDLLRTLSSRLAVTIDDLAEKIYALTENRFNINSPKQLGDVLFNKMGLPQPIKYGKGKTISTAQDVLESLAAEHEVPALVIEHRQLQKLKGTYLDALPQLADANGRIHTTFNQVGTATGRLSSTNPNLQNIPVRTAVGREIRAAFIAAEGNLLMSADYSQIELRLMAHFSQDPLLLDAYRTGKDIHTLTASEVFGIAPDQIDKETRARAKAVNFGIVYGISPFGLAAQLGIDQKTAKAYIETYYERYAGIKTFIDRTLDQVRRDQYVKTAFGRIRPIPDIQSRNPNQRGFAERTAINTPLQGTAADLIKLAMLRIDAAMQTRNLKSQMTLQVHDELLFDVPPSEAEEMTELVKTEMESAAHFTVPIVAEVGLGQNWRDIK